MSQFENCIDYVLANEGSTLFTDKTTGERSKYGITQKLLGDINYFPKDPNLLDENHAKNIYLQQFWNKYGLGRITSDVFAAKIFDMIVNMGPRQAGLLVQRALGFQNDRLDGLLGLWTIQDLNQWSEETIMPKIVAECISFYTNLANSKPEDKKFLAGWLARASKVPA